MAATLVACSSNSSGSAGTTKDSSGGGGTITIASAAPLASQFFQIPQHKAAMEAAIKSVNDGGGLNGKTLSLDFCDTGFTLNGEIACARKFTKTAAVVDPIFFIDQSGNTWKTLASANVPVVGSQGSSPAELNSPNVYPLAAGAPGSAYGTAAALVEQGATKVRILTDNNPGAAFVAQLTTAGFKSGGVTPLATVAGDPNSDPTYATAAAKATADGVNGLVVSGAPTEVSKLIKAVRDAGFKGPISMQGGSLTPDAITALGADANGILFAGQYAFTSDDTNAGVKQFHADMDKYAQGAVQDDWAMSAWVAIKLFVAATSGGSSYDAAGITTTLNELSDPVDVGGALGPWAVKARTSPLPEFSRIVNPTVTVAKIQDGKIVADGKGFIDPFTSLSSR